MTTKKKARKKRRRVGRARKRVSISFVQLLKKAGYKKGKSGWLSPDGKRFVPL